MLNNNKCQSIAPLLGQRAFRKTFNLDFKISYSNKLQDQEGVADTGSENLCFG